MFYEPTLPALGLCEVFSLQGRDSVELLCSTPYPPQVLSVALTIEVPVRPLMPRACSSGRSWQAPHPGG